MRSSSVRGRLGLPTLIKRSTIYTLVPILRHRAHILVGASVVPELCGCTSGYPAWTSATPPKICADKRAHGPVTPRKEADLLFTPAELEFSAEDEEVDIVPSFQVQDPVHDDVLTIAAGTFGPFRPSQVTQVPLWMALMLHKRRKCRINPPEWLAAGQLEDVLEAERNRPETFQELPLHYMEIAHLLFTYAKDSFGVDLVQVQDLVAELARVRRNKIQAGLRELQSALSAVKLLNLGYMEVNQIRPFFKGSLDRFFRLLPLDPERQEAVDAEPTPMQRPLPRQLRRNG